MDTLGFLGNPSITRKGRLRGMDKWRAESSKNDASTNVKPWTCARAHLFVRTPPQGHKRRLQTLRNGKETLRQGLSSSPYVDIAWKKSDGSQEPMVGLVDTGADWSLLEESQLGDKEREELQPSDAQGKGVTEAEIPIVGEVWRDMVIGGQQISYQCFIVVKKMVTPLILGADFWGRFGQFSLDFRKQKLHLSGNITLPLKKSATETMEGKDSVSIVIDETTRIPGNSQVLVTAQVNGELVSDTEEILIDPTNSNLVEGCGVPYTIASVVDGKVQVRIANVNQFEQVIEKGTTLGTGTSQFSVNVAGLATRQTNAGQDKSKVKMKEMCGGNLDTKKRNELVNLLEEFEDVFYTGGELGTVHVGVEHHIRLKDDTAPIAYRPRRLSPDEEAEVKQEIHDLMDMGVVRQSNSPWAAPIVCARKANGQLRLAIDYRGLNSVSVPATLHPIPRVEDLFDRLGEAQFFSVMDAKNGYHQLPLKEEEAELTAFIVPWGHYEFKDGTPFGLKGAGYSFQRMMTTILGNSNFVEALCYLDDILVWGATWSIHMERLRLILTKVRKANLKLGPGKCMFGVEEVEYLGANIKKGMLSISEQRVEVLRNLPKPGTVAELRSALGAFSYIQRWLPGLAEVNKPLNKAVAETGTRCLVWTPEMSESFEKLKDMTANAVSLQIPDMTRKFILVTDGSDRGVGSMLAQEPVDDSKGHLVPVAFYHHTLTKAEERYNTTYKELLAVFLSIQRFRIYLGAKFRLITDHMAIKFLKTLNVNDEKGRRGRWVEYLHQFDMELVHRSGVSKELSIADYLTRVDGEGIVRQGTIAVVKVAKEGEVPIVGFLSVEDIRSAQRSDGEIKGWLQMMSKGKQDLQSGDSYQKFLGNLVVDDKGILRILYNQGRSDVRTHMGNIERYRVVVPKSMQVKVVQFVHSSPTGGHMGFKRTYKRCRAGFWWKGMSKDVKEVVKECEHCGKNKHVTHPNTAPLQMTDIPDETGQKLQVDFLGPFQASTAHKYRYALQVQDILSRYLILIPTEKNDAITAAEVVFEEWFLRIFPPKIIQSDRGTHFASEVFEGVCRLAGVKHKMGAPDHAPSQGQVERQNQLMNQVRSLAQNKVDCWPKALSRIAYAHNSSENETRLSPSQFLYVKVPKTIESQIFELGQESSGDKMKLSPVDLAGIKLKEKKRLEAVAQTRTKESQLSVSAKTSARGDPYMVGDRVRIKLNTVERAALGGKKVAPLYSDVYVVVEVFGEGWTYRLKAENGRGREKHRHFNSLKTVQRYQEVKDGESPIEVAITRQEPNQMVDVVERNQPGENTVQTHRIGDDASQIQDNVQPIRRSSRITAGEPPPRLQVTMNRGQHYTEESVPLYEDMANLGNTEESQ